ncbi:hypothetical protein FRB90_004815 [Tulasnella sp. 427]|nr:hypothetical protein FRB90_004815 [Tulasnella sp. 427]
MPSQTVDSLFTYASNALGWNSNRNLPNNTQGKLFRVQSNASTATASSPQVTATTPSTPVPIPGMSLGSPMVGGGSPASTHAGSSYEPPARHYFDNPRFLPHY